MQNCTSHMVSGMNAAALSFFFSPQVCMSEVERAVLKASTIFQPNAYYNATPVLLVAGHPGPSIDMQELLRSFYHEKDVDIWGAYMANGQSYYRFNPTQRGNVMDLVPPVRQWPLQSSNETVIQTLSQMYAVIFAEFPGHAGQYFASSDNIVLTRFAHRFNHRFGEHRKVQPWPEFDSCQARKAFLISVNNPFDIVHMYQYSGICPLHVPSIYGSWLKFPYVASRDWVMLLPHHYNDRNPAYVKILKQLASLNITVGHANRILRTQRFHPRMLGESKIALVLPYAVHTSAINEVYAMGVPMVIPTKRYLAELHIQHGVLSHLFANLEARQNLRVVRSVLCDISLNSTAECLEEWLGYLSGTSGSCQHGAFSHFFRLFSTYVHCLLPVSGGFSWDSGGW